MFYFIIKSVVYILKIYTLKHIIYSLSRQCLILSSFFFFFFHSGLLDFLDNFWKVYMAISSGYNTLITKKNCVKMYHAYMVCLTTIMENHAAILTRKLTLFLLFKNFATKYFCFCDI